MGNDIDYPDQPTYGEGLKEALLAQIGIATGQQIGDDTTFLTLHKASKTQAYYKRINCLARH